jgi:hypothetical protein
MAKRTRVPQKVRKLEVVLSSFEKGKNPKKEKDV